jgi:hypothetical protein
MGNGVPNLIVQNTVNRYLNVLMYTLYNVFVTFVI